MTTETFSLGDDNIRLGREEILNIFVPELPPMVEKYVENLIDRTTTNEIGVGHTFTEGPAVWSSNFQILNNCAEDLQVLTKEYFDRSFKLCTTKTFRWNK